MLVLVICDCTCVGSSRPKRSRGERRRSSIDAHDVRNVRRAHPHPQSPRLLPYHYSSIRTIPHGHDSSGTALGLSRCELNAHPRSVTALRPPSDNRAQEHHGGRDGRALHAQEHLLPGQLPGASNAESLPPSLSPDSSHTGFPLRRNFRRSPPTFHESHLRTSRAQEAIAEAGTLRLKTEALRLEKDVYVYRCLLGQQNYSRVLSEIKPGAPAPLLAVRTLAEYLSAPQGSSARSSAVAQVDSWLRDDVTAASNPTVQCIAAIVYLHEGSYAQALRAVRGGASLEALALTVQTFLRIDRVDLAEKALAALQERDDESALYQRCAAQVNLTLGGERYREAQSLYQEMLQRYGDESNGASCGLAAADLCLRKFDEAERAAGEALSRDPGNAEALVSTLAALQHTGKGTSEAATKALATLRKAAPDHPFLAALAVAEASFDRVAAGFAPA
jgi:coatomer protein complex subunit epsilon